MPRSGPAAAAVKSCGSAAFVFVVGRTAQSSPMIYQTILRVGSGTRPRPLFRKSYTKQSRALFGVLDAGWCAGPGGGTGGATSGADTSADGPASLPRPGIDEFGFLGVTLRSSWPLRRKLQFWWPTSAAHEMSAAGLRRRRPGGAAVDPVPDEPPPLGLVCNVGSCPVLSGQGHRRAAGSLPEHARQISTETWCRPTLTVARMTSYTMSIPVRAGKA